MGVSWARSDRLVVEAEAGLVIVPQQYLTKIRILGFPRDNFPAPGGRLRKINRKLLIYNAKAIPLRDGPALDHLSYSLLRT